MVAWTECDGAAGTETFAALTAVDDAGRPRSMRLLEEAVGHLLSALHHVDPSLSQRPTPCDEWSLDMLLLHVADSLDAVTAGVAVGRVALVADADREPAEHGPVSATRIKACRLLGLCAAPTPPSWRRIGGHDRVNGSASVGGEAMGAAALAGIGALEIGVHAWDIAQATGHPLLLPASFAEPLLDLAPLVVTDTTRHRLFAAPVPAPADAPPAVRLLAGLGRAA